MAIEYAMGDIAKIGLRPVGRKSAKGYKIAIRIPQVNPALEQESNKKGVAFLLNLIPDRPVCAHSTGHTGFKLTIV
jgi:hypothetical protein